MCVVKVINDCILLGQLLMNVFCWDNYKLIYFIGTIIYDYTLLEQLWMNVLRCDNYEWMYFVGTIINDNIGQL